MKNIKNVKIKNQNQNQKSKSKSKLVLLFITATIISGRDIILNKNNTVSITKSIDDETISKLIHDLYNLNNLNDLNNLNNNNIFHLYEYTRR